ncbi:8-amino-7-oxononanoate synthase [Candidatus Magnetomoraceae bacterium gMMP-15]
MFTTRFKNRLKYQYQASLYRNPPEVNRREGKYLFIGSEKVLNFASNDYLGLSVSEKLKEKVAQNFLKFSTSSSSSRLVSGNYSIINQAEKEYAKYFGYEDALFFPSGYQTNLAVISTLFEQGDTLIFDKHIHASSVKGIMLSNADFYGYNHNSMKHLQKRLKAKKEIQTAVITESLFSMDGDFLDIKGIKELKKQYNFLCIVDEAHAFGAIGKNGCGIANDIADIAVGTLGKAFGLFGAFVLLPKNFKEYLINFASPLIYTTTLPEAHAASAIDILEIISLSEDKRKHLKKISLFMKKSLQNKGFKVNGDAHILALEINDEIKAVEVSKALFKKNIFAFPARYPTVPLNKAILRIGMTALHTIEDVKFFIDTLQGLLNSAFFSFG